MNEEHHCGHSEKKTHEAESEAEKWDKLTYLKERIWKKRHSHGISTILMVFTRKDGDFHGLC